MAGSVGYAVNNLNQYTTVGSASPSYDGNGNLASDGSFTYCDDAESRLTSILSSGSCSSPGATLASYAYDGRGRRKSQTVGGATTIYVTDADNREVLAYDGASGGIETWYADGLGSAAVLNRMDVAAGTRETLIPDTQGSIVATLASSTGALTKTPYLAFGENPTLTEGGFRYTAQRLDPETAGSSAQPSGLYDYRARMYSPTWGRFLQPDPAGYRAGDNLYAYVGNDPLDATDPTGQVQDASNAVSTAAAQFGCGFSGGCSIFNSNNYDSGFKTAGQITSGTLSTLGTIANYGLTAAAVIPTPLEPGAAGLRAAESGFSVAGRVAEFQEAIPLAQQGRITMGVGLAEDANGVQQVLIGTSEPMGYLRPGVTLDPGEILAPGFGHAEADIVNFAQQNGLNLLEVGATRPICPFCASLIEGVGATPVTPLKVP